MSILNKSKSGWLISHEKLVREIYSVNATDRSSFCLKPDIFAIKSPFKAANKKGKKALKKEVRIVSFTLFLQIVFHF